MAIQPSRLRITGLNSGMDTQSIVTSLMKLEQMKVDKQFRAVTRLQWKQDSYRQVNNLLRNFKDDYSTVTKQAQNMLSQINYRTNTVKLQKESNAVTMTAGSSALAGAGSVDYVAQLAKGASAVAGGHGDLNVNRSVQDLFGDDISYHYNGKEKFSYVFDKELHGEKGTEELQSLIQQYNDPNQANPEGVSVNEVKPEYFSFSIGTKTVTDGEGNQSVVPNTLTFHKDVSLSVVISAVNANSDANATLSFSQLTGEFTLTEKTTGQNSKLTFNEVDQVGGEIDLSVGYQWKTKVDGKDVVSSLTAEEMAGLNVTQQVTQSTGKSNFFDALGLSTGTHENGQNAILSINGNAIERTSNRFTADGVTYTLNRTFNAVADAGSPLGYKVANEDNKVEYTISQDVDSTFNMIKGYIDTYNTLIAKLNRGGDTSTTAAALNDGKEPGLLNQKVNRAYEPLTDEEKEKLSESQIEKWETMAKSGMLRNDAALSGLVSQLRSHFFSPVGDTGLNMTNIGLTTTANYQDGGQIQINEEKLRKTIAENPDQVYQMFAGTGDVGGNVTEKGLVRKINDSINTYVKQNEQNTLSYNNDALRRAGDRLTEMQKQLYNIEERYWAKFTAMEQALSKLNSQSGWLSAQLGSSSNG